MAIEIPLSVEEILAINDSKSCDHLASGFIRDHIESLQKAGPKGSQSILSDFADQLRTPFDLTTKQLVEIGIWAGEIPGLEPALCRVVTNSYAVQGAPDVWQGMARFWEENHQLPDIAHKEGLIHVLTGLGQIRDRITTLNQIPLGHQVARILQPVNHGFSNGIIPVYSEIQIALRKLDSGAGTKFALLAEITSIEGMGEKFANPTK